MSTNGTSGSDAASTSTLTPAEAHIKRTLELLAFERDIDLAQTSLLVSKCSPKLLETRGLAILNLQVCNVSIGLGGKTLVELERWMKGPLPSHGFRNGDTCEILQNSSDSSGKQSKKGKGKEQDGISSTASQGLQGVVYRVQDDKIILALDQDKDREDKDLEIPEKCRL
jgi:DNA polymerase alpha-associated DNA helicase A